MKKNLHAHAFSISLLIGLTILFALLLASIHQMNWLSGKNYDTAIISASMIAFLTTGIFLGFNVNKAGFIHAFIFSALYLVVIFLILYLGHDRGLLPREMLINLARAITLIIGAILGRNFR